MYSQASASFETSIDILHISDLANRISSTMSLTLTTPAGFEARGFIFGAPLALALKCAFVPLRKPGKLPGLLLSIP